MMRPPLFSPLKLIGAAEQQFFSPCPLIFYPKFFWEPYCTPAVNAWVAWSLRGARWFALAEIPC
jgi:hypothetical protein